MNCRKALSIRLEPQKGATLVEYTLMLALICLLGSASLVTLGDEMSNVLVTFEQVALCGEGHDHRAHNSGFDANGGGEGGPTDGEGGSAEGSL